MKGRIWRREEWQRAWQLATARPGYILDVSERQRREETRRQLMAEWIHDAWVDNGLPERVAARALDMMYRGMSAEDALKQASADMAISDGIALAMADLAKKEEIKNVAD